MYEIQFAATTSADWAVAIEIIDADTNQPMDLSGATFELEVGSSCDGHYLSASTADSTIISPQTGVVQWTFPATTMDGLSYGRTHRVGLTMTTDGGTTQVFVGTLSLIDGVV